MIAAIATIYIPPHCYTKADDKFDDQWLKGIAKFSSKFLSHIHSRNMASSNSLLPSKVSLEKIILFLCCHIDHVRTIHQHFHLLSRPPLPKVSTCWEKCCHGCCGIAPKMFTHDIDSHHNLSTKRTRWIVDFHLSPCQIWLSWQPIPNQSPCKDYNFRWYL